MDPQQQHNLDGVACIGVALEAKTQVPAVLLVAIYGIESRFGEKLAGKNNGFGIKHAARHALCCTVTTKEWFTQAQIDQWNAAHPDRPARKTGSRMAAKFEVALDDLFADYASLEDACADFAWLISHGAPYQKAWSAYMATKDLAGLIEGVSYVYSTSPGYRSLAHQIAGEAPVVKAIAAARARVAG